jgi:outer membrane autotransporter protein
MRIWRVALTWLGIMLSQSAWAQATCSPSFSPQPALAGQIITLQGNCSTPAAQQPGETRDEVWTLPGGGTQVRPLTSPPLTLSFGAGTQNLSVRLRQNNVPGVGTIDGPEFPLSIVVQSSGGATQTATSQITPALNQAAIGSVQTQFVNINNRMRYLRSQGSTPLLRNDTSVLVGGQAVPAGSEQGSSGESSDKAGGERGEATRTGRFGMYLAGGVSMGKQGDSPNAPGYKARTRGLTVGADYRLTRQLALGAGFGLLRADTDANDSGEQFAKGSSASFYGSWSPTQRTYLDAVVSIAKNKYELKRSDSGGGFAFARTKGGGSGLSVSGGVDFKAGAFAITPYARVEHVRADIDEFTEFGSTNQLNLRLGEQKLKTTVATLGAEVQRPVSTAWGVLLPHARLELQRQTSNSARGVTAQLVNTSVPVVVDPNTAEDRSYGQLGLGLSAQFSRGVSAFVDYELVFGKTNFKERRFNSGLKLEF